MNIVIIIRSTNFKISMNNGTYKKLNISTYLSSTRFDLSLACGNKRKNDFVYKVFRAFFTTRSITTKCNKSVTTDAIVARKTRYLVPKAFICTYSLIFYQIHMRGLLASAIVKWYFLRKTPGTFSNSSPA
jgi:hypothetical protein